MGYETITGFILISMSLIFTILSVQLKNKTLRFLFLMILMFSVTLTINYGKVILEDAGVAGDLLTLMDAGIFMATFTAITVTTYFVIYLILYVANKLSVAANQDNALDVREGIEGI